MYDTVIFDYGNTLCRMGDLASSLSKVCDSNNSLQIGQLIEEYIQQLYTPTQTSQPDWKSIWKVSFATYGETFDERIGLLHLNQFVADGTLYQYTVPLLRELKAQGTKIVLLSNVTGCTEVFQQDIEDKGIADYFDRVIWSTEIGYRKPSSHAFQLALNSIGSSQSRTLMVGDNELADIQGARAVGMATLLVSDQHVVSDFADYVVLRDNLYDEIIHLTSR